QQNKYPLESLHLKSPISCPMFFRTRSKITLEYGLFHELGIKRAKKVFDCSFIPIDRLDRYPEEGFRR
ncbi:MAG TPA: hypothetical protein VJA94_06055, partial [Candidatus Angelobacter sp.]